MTHVDQVVTALVNSDAHKATKFISEKQIVRATRPLLRGRVDKRSKGTTIVLTIGKPNYQERKFIAQCRKAGEPLPVRKVQMKFPPKRRK